MSCIACYLLLPSCSDTATDRPLPVNGVLDLRDWDFSEDGSVSLAGYWEFYYGGFLSARQFDSLPQKNYAWAPGVWKREYYSGSEFDTLWENRSHWWPQLPWEKYYWKGEKLGGAGYASYRLTLLVPPGKNHLGFKVSDMGTAYRFFIDDSLVASAGQTGTSKETSQPQYLSQIVTWEETDDMLRLTLWVSNFHYRKGGMWKTIEAGDTSVMQKKENKRSHLDFFLTGVWFMVIFVMLGFFLYRPGERSLLLLMLWAIVAFIRMVSTDMRIITLPFPEIGFEMLVKMELVSFYSLVLVGTNIIFLLFPKESSKRLNNIFTVVLLVPIVVTLFTHARFHSNFVVPFQFFATAVIIYSNYVLVRAILRKREGAMIIGIGFAIMSAILIISIPYYNQMASFSVSHETAYGFLFALVQVLLLARMFSGALRKVEAFAGELERTVELRTSELLAAQEKLIVAARLAEEEKIRRRISQDIHDDISSGLNKISWMSELARIKARGNKTEEMNATLDKIILSSRETVDHMIEIIWSLNPGSDNLENLLAYMRNYINKYFEDTAFNVNVQFPETIPKFDLNPELKRNLFLVMKEALHNAVKYSGARNIGLIFTVEDKGYVFIISDDGMGVVEGVVKGTGHGMENMVRRMEDVKGRFRVESAPGQGTRVILEGPLF